MVGRGPFSVTDTPLWLDAFPHDFTAAHERTLRGLSKVAERVYYPGARRDGGRDGAWLRITSASGRTWTGVFASELVAGRLSVIASWPQPSTLFVAVGGGPYLVDTGDPDRWSRLDRPTARGFDPHPDRGLALLLDDEGVSAYDRDGLAWESDHLGPEAVLLGTLDDEVHLRAGDLLHRVSLRHGRTVTERAPW
ncbi:MAG: hypothetical protein JWN57_2032 [Frankiales bacterium]|nr:hypothetical protein [Frankiales bacterium]